jgi:D-glycero-D-manno-heptose 1,7-bisphosphate phosphatase
LRDSIVKLVILDRDGTINEDRDDYVKSADEWVPLPGALEAVARLNHAGWHVVIASNQSGLGRGLFDMAALNAMHAKMNQLLARQGGRIDAVFFCPHAPDEHCHCRKPLPGLVEQIGERYGVNLREVPIVGDTRRDLEAGIAVGCEPHLVRTGKLAGASDDEVRQVIAGLPPVTVHADLPAFVDHLLAHEAGLRRGPADDGHARRGD